MHALGPAATQASKKDPMSLSASTSSLRQSPGKDKMSDIIGWWTQITYLTTVIAIHVYYT